MAKDKNPDPYFVTQIKDLEGNYHDYEVTNNADFAHQTHKIITKHFPHYEPVLVTRNDGDYEKSTTVDAQKKRYKNYSQVTRDVDAKKSAAKPAAAKPAAAKPAAAKPAAAKPAAAKPAAAKPAAKAAAKPVATKPAAKTAAKPAATKKDGSGKYTEKKTAKPADKKPASSSNLKKMPRA